MKLKIYLRGLGIGIVVTALIMGVATKDGRPMTDAEIKAAAAKLGMVESDQLKLTDLPGNGQGTSAPQGPVSPSPDATASPKPTGSPEPGEGSSEEGESGGEADSSEGGEPEAEEPEPGSDPAPSSTPGQAADPAPSSTPGPTAEPAPVPTPSPTPAPNPTPTPASTPETVKITIRSGTGSRAASNLLAEAGLVADAAAFDQYLCDNDYARRVCTGTFDIPVGASEEQIAKIITRSK